jgi:hypothetical protein
LHVTCIHTFNHFSGRAAEYGAPRKRCATEADSHLVRRSHRPLHEAAFHGHVPLVELLLSHGADVHATTVFGCAHRAWGWQQPESGARCRWTPLHSAVHGGHMPVTELLLSHGADVQAKTELGCGL